MPRSAKTLVDLKSLARVHTATCIRTLASIVTQPKAPANARVAAAGQLLDRGWCDSLFSLRNGFTAYFALSSVTTLFDTVACASSHRLDANDWGVRTTRLHRT